MNILIAGDYCDKYRVTEYIAKGDYTSLFGNVKSIVEQANISIVNFEFPVVLEEGKPIPKAGPNLRGQKKAVEAIKYAGFKVCTMANNHILDWGEECCLNSKKLIEKTGMIPVGVGRNIEEASKIVYIKHKDEILAIINCCEHEFSIATEMTAGANPLNPIQQYYKIQEARQNADYVLVIIHGGHEYCQLPSPRMKETYRFFIDAGADAVVNHHQHCYSGYEEYHEKPIFYGLGNFLFDNKNRIYSTWNEGYMVTFNFQKGRKTSYEIHPYIQCTTKPTIVPLAKKEIDVFQEHIKELNSIIADNNRLKKEWENWVAKNSAYFLMSFQPYNSRFTKGLFIRGLLPSFITKKKKYTILNHIECESHLDRLKYMVRNLKR